VPEMYSQDHSVSILCRIVFSPNMLTLCGFICIIIPHLLFYAYYGDELSGEVPTWLLWLTVILHMSYMNLDNLDGKQARRISTI
jgi:ethanolaminephosphotransferase